MTGKVMVITWIARVLGIVMALFISLFALDVFEDFSIVGLFMHMIPTAIVVAVLFVAWRWPLIGGLLYVGLGVFYIVWAWGRFALGAYFGISGPLFLIGALFMIGYFLRKTAIAVTATSP